MNKQRGKIYLPLFHKQMPVIINEDLNQTKIIHTDTESHTNCAIYCVYIEHFLPREDKRIYHRKGN